MVGIALVHCLPVLSQTQPAQEAAQVQSEAPQPERFWLAGRYDGNRVIVYFDAVKFNGTVPSLAERLTDPVVGGFFKPEKLPWAYVAKLQQGPDSEHFKLGDRYDLIMEEGHVATVTLTTMVGTEGDEAVGNDSYIGALATLTKGADGMYFSKGYYVVRHHRELPDSTEKQPANLAAPHAGLEREPVRFDIQAQIVALLTDRMKTLATDAERGGTEGISPTFEAQAFRLSDGSLRHYAGAAWSSGDETNEKTAFALAAWIAPQPTLHILAVQRRTSGYPGLDVPGLANVVDLGDGKSGIIVDISGEDSASTNLYEYRDGADLGHMRLLHSLSAGE